MNEYRILIVEDDPSLGEAIADTISLAGYGTDLAMTVEHAVRLCEQSMPDMIISDIQMPGMTGLDLLKLAIKKFPSMPFILMTAYGNVNDAVMAIRQGASDYLLKPFESDGLIDKIQRYLPNQRNKIDPVAEDAQSKQIFAIAQKVAKRDATILISGESGTGKEVLARYIHDHSERSNRPFVAINCAAIPENMLEATLFGYEKGAYTGAYKSQAGKFEQAQLGTLLLDEISEMSLALQAKLLRVLQERELERLGGQRTIELDVRIIATTNRQLMDYVKQGKFREDLYYRLNVFPIQWMPLSARAKDIAPLAEYMLSKHTQASEMMPKLTSSAIGKLTAYRWPGNVRELENVIQRALILKSSDEIEAEDIVFDTVMENNDCINEVDESDMSDSLAGTLRDHEFELIIDALNETKGSRKLVAEKLGLSPRTLRYKLAKMREQGIQIPY